mmetsp:Transcript_16432/g.35693  ORF Transcript_16432/g.35693 Transcript_16432/m.35693 type:complete len:248 (-) Transcript_16432:183-926(-)
MHKLKKAFHKAAPASAHSSGGVPKDAECEDLKQKLAIIRAALKTTEDTIKRTENNWKDIFVTEYKTMEELSQRYPDPDSVRDTSKTYATAAAQMQQEFNTRSASTMDYHQIAAKVSAATANIKGMEPLYKQLEELRVDYEMYNIKFSKLDLKKEKKPSEKMDEQVHRNAEKLENAKTNYEVKLKEVVDKQRLLWSRREPAYRAAYTAYFLLQAHMMDVMDKNSQAIYKYASAHEGDVETLTLSSITV